MKLFVASVLSFVSIVTFAEDKIKMNYKDEELSKILENYSKATGQSMIVDSSVRGKVTILNSTDLTKEEAFNQISEALAVNGFAIVTNGDTMTVRNARSAQRDNIPVFTSLPPAKPQRMVTYVIGLKNISAQNVMQQLRVLTSSYGEMSSSLDNNQIIISDWTSNIQRVADMIKVVDVPQDPKLTKLIEKSKKEMAERRKQAKDDKKDFAPPPHKIDE